MISNFWEFGRRFGPAALFLAMASSAAMAQNVQTFPATGLGPIPDPGGQPACNNFTAPPLDASIAVSGVSGNIVGIRVSLSFSSPHNWGADVIATLIAPGGSPSFPLFGRRGAFDNSPGCGRSNFLIGPYEFVDPSVSSNDFFNAMASPVPAGTYQTSVVGGVPSGGAPTQFIAAFEGMSVAQINGTWTLRFQDVGRGTIGTVGAAALTLQTSHDPVVRNLNDSGPGSLRYVLAGAPQFEGISFAPGLEGVIALQTTLEVPNVSVVGPGADRLELRRVAGGSVPVMRVAQGVTASLSGFSIANGQAGGIINAGTLIGTGLSIRDNAGRGVRNDAGGHLTLRASTISGNSDGSGAALLNAGIARLVNTTVTGNGVTIGSGGTIVNNAGATLEVYNTTIAANSTGGAPNAAIINAGTLALYNSVLANTSASALLINGGSLTAFNNLSIDASLPAGNGNLPSAATGLSSLALNGGTTPNFLPGGGSALIDTGRSDVLGPLYGTEPYLDQRNQPRVQGSAIDIGAVEAGDRLFSNGFET
jgi:hypothetical protein